MAGWLAGPDSPNADGLLWFLRRVFPIVRARLPWVRLRITGQNPPDNVLEHASTNVCFEGRVADLHDFYDRARVAIAPIRFGAGVKLKTIEALQFGVPTVATVVGAEGIPTASTGALLVADDPVLFAEHVCALLDAGDVWETQRHRIEALHRLWTASPAGESWVGVVTAAAAERGSKTTGHARLEGTVAG